MLRQLETAQPSMLTWRIYDPKGWIPDWFYHATTSPLYFPPLEGEPKFLSQNHSSRSHPGWAGFAHQFQLICDLKFTIQSKWCTVAPCEWFCHSKWSFSHIPIAVPATVVWGKVLMSRYQVFCVLILGLTWFCLGMEQKHVNCIVLWHYETISIYKVAH